MSTTTPPTMDQLVQVIQDLQSQVSQSQKVIDGLHNQLQVTQAAVNNDSSHSKPRVRRPESFSGKGSVTSWITHMSNYLGNTTDIDSLPIAVSYMTGSAHEWWIVYKNTAEGRTVTSWSRLKEGLVKRFDALNKEKIARDKLARWKQVKDVSAFNDDFLRIILDIPDISMDEQIDRYTRGLKPMIWRELCTNDYNELVDVMRDAERVEAAQRRIQPRRSGVSFRPQKPSQNNQGPVPMDIGNINLRKLTPAEKDQCRKEGRCFRCRQKGHMANNCPKFPRN